MKRCVDARRECRDAHKNVYTHVGRYAHTHARIHACYTRADMCVDRYAERYADGHAGKCADRHTSTSSRVDVGVGRGATSVAT